MSITFTLAYNARIQNNAIAESARVRACVCVSGQGGGEKRTQFESKEKRVFPFFSRGLSPGGIFPGPHM